MAYIKYDRIDCCFAEDEMWQLIWALQGQIKSCIGSDHYKSHPESFENNQARTISLLRDLSGAIGRQDICDSVIKEFKEWREKLKEDKND